MKILTKYIKIYQYCISEQGIFSSDSIENQVITTMKVGFYFKMWYNMQVK